MIKTSRLVALAVSLLFVCSIGFSAPKWQEKIWSNGDKNGDEALSKSEFVSVKISVAKKNAEKKNREFKKEAFSKRQEKLFAKYDANGDGKLSSDEFFASFPVKKK